MSTDQPSTQPPGWYADPTQPGVQRYWDGQAWTQHVSTPSAPPMPTAPGYPPAYGYGYPPQPQTSTYAILALVFAFVFSPLGIVFGVMGRKEIDQSGGMKTGRGLATAGMWIGIVSMVLVALYFILIIGLIAGSTSFN